MAPDHTNNSLTRRSVLTAAAWAAPVVAIAVAAPAASATVTPPTGSILWDLNPPHYYSTPASGGGFEFATLTGHVTPALGDPYPTQVNLDMSDGDKAVFTYPLSVPVDPMSGAFSVSGVTTTLAAGSFGFLYATAAGIPGNVVAQLSAGAP